MQRVISRRDFLRTALAAGAITAVMPQPARAAEAKPFPFVYLGDLHFDRLDQHDMAWLRQEHPRDISQVQEYSRITREITPRLFTTVKETIESLKNSAAPVAAVLQGGDLVEGLCGSLPLAIQQDEQALAMVREAKLGLPFLFTKGNHDITGPGAAEAYQKVLLPFLAAEARTFSPNAAAVIKASFSLDYANAQFVFFDGYDHTSLDWLEDILSRRKAQHLFVSLHQPVVPYGARANWHIYATVRQRPQRERMLELLGQQNAIVLTAHLHRYHTLVRETRRGRFLQLSASSVVPALDVQPKDVLTGLKEYNGDQVRLEPAFSPETEKERRAIYATEAPQVKYFEYADLPGHMVISVTGAKVSAAVYMGASRRLWKTLDLSKLLAQG